ncbi:hypothetical protein JNUCC0626_19950 [Lentzea sp. JNUCC 0626]|uniref:hypothetical protein n=1 Tax=Lentzea sp. JNUCC 0626 TaxID=3367513 RepID=UPI00374837FE
MDEGTRVAARLVEHALIGAEETGSCRPPVWYLTWEDGPTTWFHAVDWQNVPECREWADRVISHRGWVRLSPWTEPEDLQQGEFGHASIVEEHKLGGRKPAEDFAPDDQERPVPARLHQLIGDGLIKRRRHTAVKIGFGTPEHGGPSCWYVAWGGHEEGPVHVRHSDVDWPDMESSQRWADRLLYGHGWVRVAGWESSADKSWGTDICSALFFHKEHIGDREPAPDFNPEPVHA